MQHANARNWIIRRVEEAIEKAGGVRALARKWGCSAAHVSDMRLGRRRPGPRLQKKLGIRITRTVTITVDVHELGDR